MEDPSDVVVAVSLSAAVLLLLVLYFIPTTIAVARGHLDGWTLFLINLSLGWTLLGWVISFVWALTGKTRVNRRKQEQLARDRVAARRKQAEMVSAQVAAAIAALRESAAEPPSRPPLRKAWDGWDPFTYQATITVVTFFMIIAILRAYHLAPPWMG